MRGHQQQANYRNFEMSSFPQEDVALERLCCFQTHNILITLLGARGIVLLYKKDDLYAKVVILLHLMVLHLQLLLQLVVMELVQEIQIKAEQE